MSASEKQVNFIKNLYADITKFAGETDAETAQQVSVEIGEVKDILVKALGDEDISFADAKKVIPILISVKDKIKPANATEIRWKKVGNDWAISGDASVIIEGAEVEVTSKKGTQTVKIGKILSTDGNKTLALPFKEDVSNVTPGFYHKGDKIIEAYFTKNGFLVAREITRDGKRNYIGKAGLAGLGEKLSLEEAKAFGRKTGVCIACGALLTDPVSIEAGIGPTCASKWGLG